MEINLCDYEDAYGYYNYIGSGDLSANAVVPQIQAAKGQPLQVNIATIGGSIYDGLAIYNALIDHGDVTTVNTGYALSMGAVIAMAGKVRKTYPSSMFMMHKAGIDPFMMGRMTADDMEREMKALQTADNIMIDIFAKYTGLNKTKLNNMLAEETWLSGTDAYNMGLFTELIESGNTKAIAAKSYDHISAQMPYKMVALASKNLKIDNNDMSKEIMTAVKESSDRTNGLVADLTAMFKEFFGKKEKAPLNATFTLSDGNPAFYNDGEELVAGTAVYSDADMQKAMADGDYTLDDESKLTIKDGLIEEITDPVLTASNNAEITALKAENEQLKQAIATAKAANDSANAVMEKLKGVKSAYKPAGEKQEFNQSDREEEAPTASGSELAERYKNRHKKK